MYPSMAIWIPLWRFVSQKTCGVSRTIYAPAAFLEERCHICHWIFPGKFKQFGIRIWWRFVANPMAICSEHWRFVEMAKNHKKCKYPCTFFLGGDEKLTPKTFDLDQQCQSHPQNPARVHMLPPERAQPWKFGVISIYIYMYRRSYEHHD